MVGGDWGWLGVIARFSKAHSHYSNGACQFSVPLCIALQDYLKLY